jgi:hypothetical protein
MATIAPRTIRLGQRPATFKPVDVVFEGPDSTLLCVPRVVFKYRTRSEFGALVDVRVQFDVQQLQASPGTDSTVAAFFSAKDASMADTLADCITAWGLESEPTADILRELLDECPAAGAALWDAYASAARDGRLGN